MNMLKKSTDYSVFEIRPIFVSSAEYVCVPDIQAHTKIHMDMEYLQRPSSGYKDSNTLYS
ncbi:hypothetical protein [Methanolobus sp. WCC5]|uniref:hypothetical protein n=1 Tax=Methanolobus sp. WCC5 TaxID=3125785 RepID=UPI003255DB79